MVMEGPAFYKEVGGLVCITCGQDSQLCKCKPEKVNEKVKNAEAFNKGTLKDFSKAQDTVI